MKNQIVNLLQSLGFDVNECSPVVFATKIKGPFVLNISYFIDKKVVSSLMSGYNLDSRPFSVYEIESVDELWFLLYKCQTIQDVFHLKRE